MAVRLVMGDIDIRYLEQMQGFLEKNFSSEVEIHSFTDAAQLEAFLRSEGADVALVNPRIGMGAQRLYRAGAVAVAYLDEQDGEPDVTGERIIGKYKRPDVFLGIVKEIAEEGAAKARVRARVEADRARQAAEEEARIAAAEAARRAAEEEAAKRAAAMEAAKREAEAAAARRAAEEEAARRAAEEEAARRAAEEEAARRAAEEEAARRAAEEAARRAAEEAARRAAEEEAARRAAEEEAARRAAEEEAARRAAEEEAARRAAEEAARRAAEEEAARMEAEAAARRAAEEEAARMQQAAWARAEEPAPAVWGQPAEQQNAWGQPAEQQNAWGQPAEQQNAWGQEAPQEPAPVFGIPSDDDPWGEQSTLAGLGGAESAFSGPAAKLIAVTSFSGGTGVTTVSAALAKNLAARGFKVLYLNLEAGGSSETLFQSDDRGSLEDVLRVLESRGEATAAELTGSLCLSREGVYFYRPCEDPGLILNLSSDHILELLGALRYANMFSYIVMDFNFIVSPQDLRILDSADRVLILNDGSVTANVKFMRTLRTVRYLEQLTGISVTGRMGMVYNKFSSSKSSNEVQEPGIDVIGKIPPIMHATTEEIVAYMTANMKILKRIS